MNNIFFSIIIPTFNSKNTIGESINSILNQSFQNFEILVMDGLSKDETVQIVSQYGDARIRIFSEKDAGVYDAMNKGIEMAKGEWIYYLGSDDYLVSESVLGNVASHLSKSAAEVVYGDVRIKGDCGWAKDGEIYKGETSVAELFKSNICHQAIFYKKELFIMDSKRFELKYIACADYDLNLYFASKYKLRYIPVTIAVFEGGGISSVREDTDFAAEKWVNILKYYGKRLEHLQFGEFVNDFWLLFKGSIKKLQLLNAISAYWIFLNLSIKTKYRSS